MIKGRCDVETPALAAIDSATAVSCFLYQPSTVPALGTRP